jgi:GNAT superfamily N-acetyltransferase
MLCAMRSSDAPAWHLRRCSDADFEWAFALHRAALKDYVEQTWGWHETDQRRIFADQFQSQQRRVIQVAGNDVGVLIVEERPDDVFLDLLELLPAWQGKGLGTDILRWLLRRAADSGRPLRLHVLRANPRAAALYEREGLRVVASNEVKLVMRSDVR